MAIQCNELNQVYAELLMSFQNCKKIKNSDLRKLTEFIVALNECNSGEGGGGLQNIITDSSLYFDILTRILRSNVGQVSNVFNYMSGPKEFILVDKPVNIVYISVNGNLLNSPVTDWNVDINNKKITILIDLEENSKININYQYIITE